MSGTLPGDPEVLAGILRKQGLPVSMIDRCIDENDETAKNELQEAGVAISDTSIQILGNMLRNSE